jgi:FtsH-binding integral membrane protein
MANTYVGKVNAQGKVFVKKQASVLSKSLLVAGIAFILIFAFSFGLFSFLEKKYGANVNSNVITILYVISIVCLIATLIMCFVVSTKINKCKLSTIITMIALYGIANGICFGLLFYAIQHTNNVHVNMSDILYCFLITGCVFAVSGIVGTLLSVKFTLTLGKFLLIATLTFFLVYIILMIVMIFSGLRDSTYYLI